MQGNYEFEITCQCHYIAVYICKKIWNDFYDYFLQEFKKYFSSNLQIFMWNGFLEDGFVYAAQQIFVKEINFYN